MRVSEPKANTLNNRCVAFKLVSLQFEMLRLTR